MALFETSISLSFIFAHISCHLLTELYSRLIRSGHIVKIYNSEEEHGNSIHTEQGMSDSVGCRGWSLDAELDGHGPGHSFMVE